MASPTDRAALLQTKVAELKAMLDNCNAKTKITGGCMPYLIAIAIAAPFFIWAVLYFGKPGFVQRKEGSKMVRSGTKVFFWTVLLTIIVWAVLYGWHLYRSCSSCSL